MAMVKLDDGMSYFDYYAKIWNDGHPNNKVRLSDGMGGGSGGGGRAGHGPFDDTVSPIGGQYDPPSGTMVKMNPPKRIN